MNRTSSSIHRHIRSAAVAWLLPLLAGCGSAGHQNPVAPSAPTGVSGTLVVAADAVSNESAGSFQTTFTVSLADTGTGAAASGATVEFNTPSGTVSLSEDAGTPGTYRGQRAGHDPGLYALSVVRRNDVASGSVSMPDAHVITSPAVDDTISTNGSLDVTWTRSAASSEAWIDTKDWTTTSQADNGSGKVPKGHNEVNSNQSVGVTRRNNVNPAGMASGSVMHASVRVSVEPVIVQ